MPELLTKHPDVVMKLLQQAGGKCGAGQEQTILKNCPPERFCTVPGGEMCVFGLEQARQMTQISAQEFATHACPRGETRKAAGSCTSAGAPGLVAEVGGGGVGLALAIGALVLARRWRQRVARDAS
jgi:hypothetical protein